MKKSLLTLLAAVAAIACSKSSEDLTQYVDTSIGTGGHGHVFVGANVPYGNLFDITLLPVSGPVTDYSREAIADKADRSREVSVPGYYSVPLTNSGVLCEMTATARVGLSRYTFPGESAAIILDLQNGGCWDKVTSGEITVVDNTHIVGHRHSTGWAKDQKLWFAAEFSAPFTASEVAPYHWRLDFEGTKQVMVKVALSPKSTDGAAANMAQELPGWDFEATRSAAKAAWNSELGKIKIETKDADARTIFYTSLYHTMIAPSLLCDCGDTTAACDKQGDMPVWHLMCNEPSYQAAYLYNLAGQPWKTADLVRRICKQMYTTAPDGLCGNEDVGQMSAWYVLSSLGFYQVEPAGGRYYFGSPLFDKAQINVGSGKHFTIIAEGNSETNRYIQKIMLNGRPYTKNYIDYKDIMAGGELLFVMGSQPKLWYCAEEPAEYVCQRPAESERLFTTPTIENTISQVQAMLTNPRLAWMFGNCFPNTLDTTVHFTEDDGTGHPDTFVYTGDIHAMWLRDSGAQVWPYLRFANEDEHIRAMLEGTIRRQLKCLCIDPYANAFNKNAEGSYWMSDNTEMKPELHERKWEIDSQCYPIRLAYGYWKKTGDESVFDATWVEAMTKVLAVLREQQRFGGLGSYYFTRECDRQYDMKCNDGYGNPVKPCGLIASAFRPSDDATVMDFLVPSNFFAVTSLRKAAEILSNVNGETALAQECLALAAEVEQALKDNAIVEHPVYGKIYAFEVDGFGGRYLMDDANVPSLLALGYLGDVDLNDKIYQNTRNFVLSAANPYRFEGPAGAGIGGPHIGYDYIWPMSIMMRAFTSQDDEEIRDCIIQLMTTDAGKGFMHESYNVENPAHFTREWFAWQNTLFGELILKLIDDGKLDLLNSII